MVIVDAKGEDSVDFSCESNNGKPVTIGFDTDPVNAKGPGFLDQENMVQKTERNLFLNRRHREDGVVVSCYIAASDEVCSVKVMFINVGEPSGSGNEKKPL